MNWKRILILFGIISLFTSADAQQILNLLTGEVREGEDAAEPVKTVEKLDNGYLVTWDFSEAFLYPDDEFPNCIMWNIPRFMFLDAPGSPAFSYQNDWFTISDSVATMEIVDSCYMDFSYELAPAIPMQPIGTYPYSEVTRLPIKPYDGFKPISTVECLSKLRDNRACYRIIPIQYNYEQQIVRAYTKIVYKVTLSDSTTGIEELKAKEDMSTNSFTLDGRPVKSNTKSVIVQDGKKRIVR